MSSRMYENCVQIRREHRIAVLFLQFNAQRWLDMALG
jgi:hypothetical protein